MAVRAATRGVANQLVDLAFEQPVLTARLVEERLSVSRPSALTALRQLEDLSLLVAGKDGPRGQLRWRAHQVITILSDEPSAAPRT